MDQKPQSMVLKQRKNLPFKLVFIPHLPRTSQPEATQRPMMEKCTNKFYCEIGYPQSRRNYACLITLLILDKNHHVRLSIVYSNAEEHIGD